MSSHAVQDEINIEKWSKGNKNESPPPARRYVLRINNNNYIIETREPTGAQILGLAAKKPDEFRLNQIFRGGAPIEVGPDDTVDLGEPGVERFICEGKMVQNGEAKERVLHRQFQLPERDVEALDNNLVYPWEAVVDNQGTNRLLLIHDLQPPDGFVQPTTTMAFRILPGYPTTSLDMAYFTPALTLTNGLAIPAVSSCKIMGIDFQQWSRHRTGTTAWDPVTDGVLSHFAFIWTQLESAARG